MLSYLTATKQRSVLSYSLIQGLLLALFFLTAPMSAHAQTQEEAIRTKVICKEGYKFLLVWNASQWRPPSVVQIFKASGRTGSQSPQPMKCGK